MKRTYEEGRLDATIDCIMAIAKYEVNKSKKEAEREKQANQMIISSTSA